MNKLFLIYKNIRFNFVYILSLKSVSKNLTRVVGVNWIEAVSYTHLTLPTNREV